MDFRSESLPRPFPNSFLGSFSFSPRRENFRSNNNESSVTPEPVSSDNHVTPGPVSSNARDYSMWWLVIFIFFSFFALYIILWFNTYYILQLGPNTSMLINPNQLLVESIQIEALDAGLMIYGFDKPPPLDVPVSFSELHSISFPGGTHKEWMYYLNKGSQMNISYSLESLRSSSLVLAIAEDEETLDKWIKNPSSPFGLFFDWSKIHGNGIRQEDIFESSSYFVALGNLNYNFVKVDLNISIKSLLYNTTESNYKCAPVEHDCTFDILLTGQNSFVIETPSIETDRWNIKISYKPRWLAYLLSAGAVAGLALLIIFVLKCLCRKNLPRGEEAGTEQDPLLPQKDEDDEKQQPESSQSAVNQV